MHLTLNATEELLKSIDSVRLIKILVQTFLSLQLDQEKTVLLERLAIESARQRLYFRNKFMFVRYVRVCVCDSNVCKPMMIRESWMNSLVDHF